MLEAHPDLAVVDESYFPLGLWLQRRLYVSDGLLDLPKLAEDILKEDQFHRVWGVEAALLRSRFATPEAVDFSEALRRLYALHAEVRGKLRYGDKTPWFVHEIGVLAKLFQEARFVHIIRDGRDVALSVTDAPFGPRRIEYSAAQWSSLVAKGREEGRKLGDSRYIEVRYEELTRDPERVIRPVCELFELNFTEAMLSPVESWRRDPPEQVVGRSYDPAARLRDWRHEMPTNRVAVYEAIAGAMLSELGYPRRFPRVPRWARVKGMAYRERFEFPFRLRRLAQKRRRLQRVSRNVLRAGLRRAQLWR
jgi:hypothetical protein